MPEAANALAPFAALIESRCGLRFEAQNAERLQQALAARRGETPPAAYLARLQHDEAEFQALVNRLTINETYFFREPEQIRHFTAQLLPELLAARPVTQKIRILSAGCASGEEPYSLLIAAHEQLGALLAARLEIVGIDIDSEVLAQARAARYRDFSFRGTPPEFRQRHFETRPDKHAPYHLKRSLATAVEFRCVNLLDTRLPADLGRFDAIFLRNVSIYFDEARRRQLLARLAGLLAPDGLLLVGSAETLANDLGVLHLVARDGHFHFTPARPSASQAAAAAPAAAPKAAAPVPSLPPLQAPAPLAPESVDWQPIRQWLEAKDYRQAGKALARLLGAQPRHLAGRLLQAWLDLEQGHFAAAEGTAEAVLGEHPWSVDALLLLALAARWSERPAAAIAHLRRAIYSKHECWPAHFHLGELLRQTGEPALAERSYRIVMQLIDRPQPDTGLLYLPTLLPLADVRFLCAHRLQQSPTARRA